MGGDKVQLIVFDTFETRGRAERIGENPKTGEEVIVSACKVPAFKPCKTLKDAINKQHGKARLIQERMYLACCAVYCNISSPDSDT